MNFSTMFANEETGEYWPELQAEIDRWQQVLSDDPGALNHLVFALMEAAGLHRKLAECQEELQVVTLRREIMQRAADAASLNWGEMWAERDDLRRQLAEAQAQLVAMRCADYASVRAEYPPDRTHVAPPNVAGSTLPE